MSLCMSCDRRIEGVKVEGRHLLPCKQASSSRESRFTSATIHSVDLLSRGCLFEDQLRLLGERPHRGVLYSCLVGSTFKLAT